jgi:hypothetical protein
VQEDRSVDSHTLTLNGVAFAKGIGTHANSQIFYNVNGQYTRFKSTVGVDSEVGSGGSVIFQIFADSTKIFDSGLMNGSTAAKAVDVDITGKNQLQLVVTDGGDGMSSDHADWADARITTSTSTIPTTPDSYLSNLNWVSAATDWGTVYKGKTVDNHTLTLDGVQYLKGIGTHANSEIIYDLNGQYSRFTATVGVDDEVNSNGSVAFQVFADGTKIYDSLVMTGSTARKLIDVSVAGKNQLKLVVTDGGDGISSDHADWADAKLSN